MLRGNLWRKRRELQHLELILSQSTSNPQQPTLDKNLSPPYSHQDSKMPKPKKQSPTPQKHNQPPNWPPLRPLLPPTDLHLQTLLPDQIYLISNFLPTPLCKTYTSFLSSLPLTTTPGKPKKDEAVRVNDRFQVEDGRFAEMLWSGTAMRELVTTRFGEGGYNEEEVEDVGEVEDGQGKSGELAQLAKQTWGGDVLGLNPNIRIYRYSKGQFFAQHCMSNTLPDKRNWTPC